MKKEPPFKSEAELCAAFIADVPEQWQAYPETEGWDILLVHKTDRWQIGIEAKLKLNAKVLTQASEGRWDQELGPDFRAVLVPPGGTGELAELARHCCITVITMRKPECWESPSGRSYRGVGSFYPELPWDKSWTADVRGASGDDLTQWFEMMPVKRLHVPEYIPDVTAGVSSPVQLTRWKVSALRIAVLLETTGFVTRSDFKAQQIDVRRWIEGRWIVPGINGFVVGPRMPEFRKQHPVVWDQIVADKARWTRRVDVPLMEMRGQTGLL